MTPARADYAVLVCESHTVGSIAVIRSLGCAGYKVLACSPQADALGFRSRYAHEALVCPDYRAGDRFLAWLNSALDQHNVRCIIPSEGFLLAARPRFDEIRHLLPLSQDERHVYRAMSKLDLFDSFCSDDVDARLREHLPAFHYIDSSDECDLDISGLSFPVYVKTDGVYSTTGASGNVHVAIDESELAAHVQRARREFSRFLLQGHAAGVGVGVFALRWQGHVYARFMHRRLHEVPHSGGVSSLREGWWNQAIYDDAMTRLEAMDWQGVGMLEYRWDEASGEFCLLEFNGRFWGSLHLALYAGVDFPALLVDAFFGHPREGRPARIGMKCRLTFPKEVEYVWSCLKDREMSPFRKLWVVLEFFLLGADPRVRSDMLYAGDRGLYISMRDHAFKTDCAVPVLPRVGRQHDAPPGVSRCYLP